MPLRRGRIPRVFGFVFTFTKLKERAFGGLSAHSRTERVQVHQGQKYPAAGRQTAAGLVGCSCAFGEICDPDYRQHG